MNFYQTNINTIVSSLYALGLRHAVICPGSRNAPLVMAFARFGKISCTSLVDERSAAFVALGMAKQLQTPVAIICTSGSAVVNLYPAITEAYYMQVPLLVITADRPSEMIDRWDGQTIKQFEVFKPHTLGSFQTPENIEENNFNSIAEISYHFYQTANGIIKGPAHLNVPLKEPLYAAVTTIFEYPVIAIDWVADEPKEIETFNLPKLNITQNTKILILCGADYKTEEIYDLKILSQNKFAIVIADVISNKHFFQNINNWESLLLNCNAAQQEEFVPDILITNGKMVLNKTIKQLLRKQAPKTHYHIAENGYCANAFFSNPIVLKTDNQTFFKAFNSILPHKDSSYFNGFNSMADAQLILGNNVIQQNYNEFNAVKQILENLPENICLHLANSLSIRYAAYLSPYLKNSWQIYSNRGVSGIDGCTSTAIGAALVSTQQHILITGDIAFFYDINALWQEKQANNFRLILLNNFGGNIFKVIEGPAKMPELNPYLETPHSKNAALMAQHFNIKYYMANNAETLETTLQQWLADTQCAILEIQTNSTQNTTIFNQYKYLTL